MPRATGRGKTDILTGKQLFRVLIDLAAGKTPTHRQCVAALRAVVTGQALYNGQYVNWERVYDLLPVQFSLAEMQEIVAVFGGKPNEGQLNNQISRWKRAGKISIMQPAWNKEPAAYRKEQS